MLFVHFILLDASLVASTSAVNFLEKFVSEMTHYVSSGMLSSAQSFIDLRVTSGTSIWADASTQ